MSEIVARNPEAGEPREDATGIDRRLYPRRSCRYQCFAVPRDEHGGRCCSGICLGGAGVLLASPVEVGAAVTFTVYATPGRVHVIRATVRRVESHEGEWLAGCEFLSSALRGPVRGIGGRLLIALPPFRARIELLFSTFSRMR